MEHDFTLGFESQHREIRLDGLSVRGAIPPWLSGTLIRNGPAQFEIGQRSFRHWFDGLAMLHKFSFHEGKVSYANRLLQSRAQRESSKTGRICYREFATDPCRSLFGRLASLFSNGLTDNANVNVTRLANRLVAMTETPLPVEFSPDTLETAGVFNYVDGIGGQMTTAHPHLDPGGADIFNFMTRFATNSNYLVYRISSGDAARQVMATIPVKEPGYMHSFAITERYVVLVEFPLLVAPWRLLLSGRPFIENYRWKPERGSRFLVIDRNDGQVLATCHADAFFAFHHVNAFEQDGELVIDIAAYPDSSIIAALYLDQLRSRRQSLPTAELRRYRVPLADAAADYDVVSKEPIELPRISYRRCNGRDYAFAYGIGMRPDVPGDFYNQLLRINVRDGTATTWSEDKCYPGEPVFVSAPDARDENDGVILSVVLDACNANSYLLVLDAASFREIARAAVPQHIPFGFHGQFFAV